jgi:hypothetical protein
VSYIFLQAQGEESSADSYSGIDAYALSNGIHTRGACSCNGNATGPCQCSRYGMTSRRLTALRGVAALMWLRVVSRVRTYRRLDAVPESTANALECGDTWPASLARYDRDSRSWRTVQCSLLAGLTSSSVTWPRSGMMRNGVCWERTTPELRTSGSASGFLPTPLASNTKAIHMRSDGRPARSYLPTPTATANMLSPSMQKWPAHRNLWPTPVADGDRTTNYAQGGTSLGWAVRNWPTPTVQDAKNNGAPSQMVRNTPPLNAVAGGALNPPWVEWLMGWPIGWTDLQPLAMVKYRRWLRSHGKH